MQDEGFAFCATSEAVDVLRVTASAESGDNERLCFATVEDGRAVNARQHASFARNGAKINTGTTVNTLTGIEDVLAVELFLDFVECASDVVTLYIFSTKLCFERGFSFLSDDFDRELALGVAIKSKRTLDLFSSVFFAEVDDRLRCYEQSEFFLRFAAKLRELFLSHDDWLDSCLAVDEGFVETLVRDEFSRSFDHQHLVFRTDVDEVEVGIEHFVVSWVGDEFAINLTDTHTTDWAVPRDVRDQCRSRSGVDHKDIWLVDLVCCQEKTDYLHFIHEALRKERTKWTVAKAGCEDFLLGRFTFALEIATGELTASREFFAVINREREEILPRAE